MGNSSLPARELDLPPIPPIPILDHYRGLYIVHQDIRRKHNYSYTQIVMKIHGDGYLEVCDYNCDSVWFSWFSRSTHKFGDRVLIPMDSILQILREEGYIIEAHDDYVLVQWGRRVGALEPNELEGVVPLPAPGN